MSTIETEYLVSGMTCAHCVRSVTEEISALPKVSEINIDLVAGGSSRVRVTSAETLNPDAVRAAIEEAGYTLATQP